MGTHKSWIHSWKWDSKVVAKDVKPFKHLLMELGARENATWSEAVASCAPKASETPLPEPVLPQKLLKEWRVDFDLASHARR